MKPILIHITTHDAHEAEKIATHIVKNRLASCVWITPLIHSVYTWKGKLYHDKEALLTIKTFDKKFKQIESAIKKLHRYEIPAIIATPVTKYSKDYLKWSAEAVR